MTRVEIWMGSMTYPHIVIEDPQEVRMSELDATVLVVAKDGTRFETAPQNVLLVIGKGDRNDNRKSKADA